MRLKSNGLAFSQCYPDWVSDVTDLILADQTEATFGVFGRWGSGKSSALDAIMKAVPYAATKMDRHVMCMVINCLDLQRSVLLEKLDQRVNEIIGRSPGGPLLSPGQVKTASTFLRSVVAKGIQALSSSKGMDPATAEFTGMLSEGIVGAGVEMATTPLTTEPAPLAELKPLLADTHVLWFLDDLDRCYPDRAINFLAQASELFNTSLEKSISSSLIFACDPEVLGRHAAAVYGISLSEGLEAITKYIHVPISVPIMLTRPHVDTILQYIPAGYREVPVIVKILTDIIGILPVRELLSAIPQAFLWYERCMKSLPGDLSLNPENGQVPELFRLFLWWSLVSINLPAIYRYLLKDIECVNLIEHLFKVSSLSDSGGGDRIVASFGDLAIETIRLRPDFCCAFSKLLIAKFSSNVIRFSLEFVGGGTFG